MTAAPTSPHTLHIPVMGTGFTADTPLRMARLGLTSVISLVDDDLLEALRGHHARLAGEPFDPIPARAPDVRARRVTAYLDLVDRLVARQVEALRAEPFTPESVITRWFRLLPDGPLRTAWLEATATRDPAQRRAREAALRAAVVPGRLEANLMTPLNIDTDRDGTKRPPEAADGVAAVRGVAATRGCWGLVLSAGFHPMIYAALGRCEAFLPTSDGPPRKHVILKVSDFRSAAIQGRWLAKRGIWVSEFRVESSLNCGGHAFANGGRLLGPVLDEFARERTALVADLHAARCKALAAMGRPVPATVPPVRLTAQGGIGTAAEDRFLRTRYGLDGTGWATPFLLVPEVTNVDPETRARLLAARPGDVVLSDSSPLGVPFWTLRTSPSEEARRARIAEGKPGSPCPLGYVAYDTEFGTPFCHASRAYQERKLAQLATAPAAAAEPAASREAVMAKACICYELGGGARLAIGAVEEATSAICPGPNLVWFGQLLTLEQMCDHVYGRVALPLRPGRPNFLVRELELVLDFLATRMATPGWRENPTRAAEVEAYRRNVADGIAHTRLLAPDLPPEERAAFLAGLDAGDARLRAIA